MREWKYVRDGLVHDVETWNETTRLRTPRCDVADRIYHLSFIEHPTTCLECLSVRGSYVMPPPSPLPLPEPGIFYDSAFVHRPAERNPCVEIPYTRFPTESLKGRYGS